MILQVTHNGNTLYIDTGMIFYAYDDSGCYLYLDVNPETLKQYGVSLNDVVIDYSVPGRVAQIQISESYSDIKAFTQGYGFYEFGNADFTNILVNCHKAIKVEDISGDGLIWFDNYSSVQTTDAIADVQNWINLAVDGKDTTDASIADQVGFDTDTYVTDSDIIIPSHGFAVRSMFYWRIAASKTAAGVAQPVYSIRVGTDLDITDGAILQLTGSDQSADADNGVLHVMATIREIGLNSIIQGSAWWAHKAASGSHAIGFCRDNTGQIDGTSATFDSTAFAGQSIGLSIDAGTDAEWTITQVHAQVNW